MPFAYGIHVQVAVRAGAAAAAAAAGVIGELARKARSGAPRRYFPPGQTINPPAAASEASSDERVNTPAGAAFANHKQTLTPLPSPLPSHRYLHYAPTLAAHTVPRCFSLYT